MKDSERRKLFHTFLFPCFFLLVLWVIKISEFVLEKDFATLGVYPRDFKGLVGIFLSPLIHGSFKHLIGNSVPVFFLSLALFYYYHKIAFRVFMAIYVAVGLWVWIAARPSYHIGASGVVYGLAAFHFLSGILRRHGGLMAFSMLVVFLYGSMVWGILPIEESISWESHLFGMVAGIICAIVYRKEGPQKKEHVWEEENENENENDEESDEESEGGNEDEEPGNQSGGVTIKYTFIEKGEEGKKN